MGFLWDLIQQSQLSEHATRAASDAERITRLEHEVARQSVLIRELVMRLERRLDVDLDRDGKIAREPPEGGD